MDKTKKFHAKDALPNITQAWRSVRQGTLACTMCPADTDITCTNKLLSCLSIDEDDIAGDGRGMYVSV